MKHGFVKSLKALMIYCLFLAGSGLALYVIKNVFEGSLTLTGVISALIFSVLGSFIVVFIPVSIVFSFKWRNS